MSPSVPASSALPRHGEIDAGRLVDQRDRLVARHQIGLGEIGGPQRLTGAQLRGAPACRWRGRARSRVVADFGLAGGARCMTSDALRTSLRSTARVSTAASTVSTAVPVKRSRVGVAEVSLGDLERDVEAAAARVVMTVATGTRSPPCDGIELHVAQFAVEGQRQIGGVAEAAAALERLRHLLLDVLGLAACATRA